MKDGQDAQDITVPIAQVEKLKLVFTMEKGKGSVATIDFGNAIFSKLKQGADASRQTAPPCSF
ncbi:hypothetical protein GCM10008018_50480 [Paenibacillus marchantiophytorum]|uniref:Uncharacterized protein n=1 Tax=Paenibacillus marchantiophytorum TaxID=1619310 RepID=A0ABQ1F3E9_9BACL|nr:hypothetical protein GCM10008018_50480 [Paenibacillus marchantiophytorum]